MQRKKRKQLRVGRADEPRLVLVDREWAMDFLTGGTGYRVHIRILRVLDACTDERLALAADTSLGSGRVSAATTSRLSSPSCRITLMTATQSNWQRPLAEPYGPFDRKHHDDYTYCDSHFGMFIDSSNEIITHHDLETLGSADFIADYSHRPSD